MKGTKTLVGTADLYLGNIGGLGAETMPAIFEMQQQFGTGNFTGADIKQY